MFHLKDKIESILDDFKIVCHNVEKIKEKPDNRYFHFEEGTPMLEKKIRLNAVSEVTEFVRAAEKCKFDVDIFYNRVVVDAKSIIGVMSMDLTKTLTVKYSKEDCFLETILNKFEVA